MPARGLVVREVMPGSIAALLRIEPGDRLLAVNGQPLQDVLDYRFFACDEEISLRVLKKSGEERVYDLEKEFDEDLGLFFEGEGLEPLRRCQNRCLFCFVDQMPPGMRPTLYFKDDDYRLSFLHGNFITLTNLREADFRRIGALRLSPLYVSVHTTNPSLREKMLGHRRAGRITDQLKRLAGMGIELHTQIVLCPGLNDGGELERTLNDLLSLWPAVRSVAVVPVGLTRYREGLYPLRPFSPREARLVLEEVHRWQERCLSRWGQAVVYASDEFYLLAGEEVPPAWRYDDFPQTENGVGLVRLFADEWAGLLCRLPRAIERGRSLTLVTGELAAGLLGRVVERLNGVQNLRVDLAVVPNRFFGEQVTVAGLLTGRDICEALRGRELGETVVLPGAAVRLPEGLLLDDLTLDELSRRLSRPVVLAGSPKELLDICLKAGDGHLAQANSGHCGAPQRG
ncbi:DUF512 domain-containing protein [Desulfovirgula thermocuniculi]|uniref:DUF512 domain-containing protein n=1 Tax=Desulfovirgula thermocuniculi TaxID=348842 RepID=UPI0012EBB35B|nr:DUF512 domain-containing protein [Desulfovirgula thermocuniculi]